MCKANACERCISMSYSSGVLPQGNGRKDVPLEDSATITSCRPIPQSEVRQRRRFDAFPAQAAASCRTSSRRSPKHCFACRRRRTSRDGACAGRTTRVRISRNGSNRSIRACLSFSACDVGMGLLHELHPFRGANAKTRSCPSGSGSPVSPRLHAIRGARGFRPSRSTS